MRPTSELRTKAISPSPPLGGYGGGDGVGGGGDRGGVVGVGSLLDNFFLVVLLAGGPWRGAGQLRNLAGP